ncbi:MAG: bifunctional L-myo-inositol-1-phosphate cytidylyltransferase/CDP-L-myo-inositol myo-inositolphosphotransferase [Archaeoglobaceae archaeon]
MKGVILAAGVGSRMGYRAKPLVKVGGIEIIARTVKLLQPYVDEFVIVASIYADEIKSFLDSLGVKYTLVRNPNPERGNGYSLLLAEKYVDDKFVLVMGDHVYSREFVEAAIRCKGLVGDRRARYVDVREATKVKVRDGRVAEIGKEVKDFDCIDTGFLVLDKSVFDVAKELRGEVITLSDIVAAAKLPVCFVDGEFWMDIDTMEDVRRANELLVKLAVKGTGDGFVSRHLNRKISTRISALLVNRVTPNQMTLLSFLIGTLSALAAFFNAAVGGVIYQLSSIIDGCDGEIARASLRSSRVGGYVDSVLDRVVDFAFLLALALRHGYFELAMLAVFGSVMVSYSTEKYKAEFGRSAYDEIKELRYIPGKRDERIFLIFLLCLSSVAFDTIPLLFAVIAALGFLKFSATAVIVWLRAR